MPATRLEDSVLRGLAAEADAGMIEQGRASACTLTYRDKFGIRFSIWLGVYKDGVLHLASTTARESVDGHITYEHLDRELEVLSKKMLNIAQDALLEKGCSF